MTSPPAAASESASRLLIAAVGSTLLAQMPAFMLGGLAIFVRGDLGFGHSQLGVAVGVFFAASAAGAIMGGRLAQHLGARTGMSLAALLSFGAMIAIALLAQTWLHLVIALFVGGVANAIGQPASNLALIRGMPTGQQGFAFGIKQASVPLISLLAGIAVPVIALTVGWRWAFVGAGVLGMSLILIGIRGVARRPVTDGRRSLGGRPDRRLLLFGLVGFIGTAGTTCTATYIVESMVAGDVPIETAGIALAIGSTLAVVSRLALGWRIDRATDRRIPALFVAGAFVVAGIGFAVSGFGTGAVAVVGGLFALVGASGWQGVLHFMISSTYRPIAATATGVAQTGMFSGGVIGPIIFGLFVEAGSFATAWAVIAVAMVVGIVVVLLADRSVPAEPTLESARKATT